MIAGLVSVSFRQLRAEAVIRLAAECRLSCLEWGSDIHVPVGDLEQARKIGRWTREAGLSICSYGSYYCLQEATDSGQPFETVVETALALGAPDIRVWAGRPSTFKPYKGDRIITHALRAATIAEAAGLSISYERHAGTLTETNETYRRLLEDTPHPAIRALWQPPMRGSLHESLEGLRTVLPRLHHIHVSHWESEQLSLTRGEAFWRPHLSLLQEESTSLTELLLEFVPGNDPNVLSREADILLHWIDLARETQGVTAR